MPLTFSPSRADNVKWVYDTNVDLLNHHAADSVIRVLQTVIHPVIGFATGSTPLGLYQILVQKSQEDTRLLERWKHVTTFNLDEYVGIDERHPQSYRTYMWKNLFSYLPVDKAFIHIPSGENPDESACENYEKKLVAVGWADLQILGIGKNGHIGFNEPDDHMKLYTHITQLRDGTREANARFFSSRNEVPEKAITMGIGDILQAKQIILLAYGAEKREALSRAFSGIVSTHCPASFLQLHPHVTVFTDQPYTH